MAFGGKLRLNGEHLRENAMGIFSVFIINKAGGLIFQYDHYSQRPEVEKTFSFPIELVLKQQDEKLVVAFGERDGIKGVLLCIIIM